MDDNLAVSEKVQLIFINFALPKMKNSSSQNLYVMAVKDWS